jgi:hypothetical protein
MEDSAAKLLQFKAQRTQVAAKLADWEESHRQSDGREATPAQRQRSSQHRQLTKLMNDLDGFIQALEVDDPSLIPAAGASRADRADRGRTKSRMRQWDRDFEKLNGRKPTEADHESSAEFRELRGKLQGAPDADSAPPPAQVEASGSTDASSGADASAPAPASRPLDRLGPWEPALSAALGGGEYYETARSRITSMHVMDGFAGVKTEEARLARERRPCGGLPCVPWPRSQEYSPLSLLHTRCCAPHAGAVGRSGLHAV